MVRNEVDIIESFARHNLTFKDERHVIVQPSDAATRWTVDKLREEELSLLLTEDSDPGYMQGERLTEHGRRLLTSRQCTAVVFFDADEFFKVPSKASLVNIISSVPADCLACWEWQSYVPTVESASGNEPITRVITHRRRSEPSAQKMILTRLFAERPDLRLTIESHVVCSPAGKPGTVKAAHLRGYGLGHFPVRSTRQLSAKIRRGVAVSNKDLAGTQLGYHWHMINKIIAERGLGFDVLQRIAYDYQFKDAQLENDIPSGLVCDPIPSGFSVRYSAIGAS